MLCWGLLVCLRDLWFPEDKQDELIGILFSSPPDSKMLLYLMPCSVIYEHYLAAKLRTRTEICFGKLRLEDYCRHLVCWQDLQISCISQITMLVSLLSTFLHCKCWMLFTAQGLAITRMFWIAPLFFWSQVQCFCNVALSQGGRGTCWSEEISWGTMQATVCKITLWVWGLPSLSSWKLKI